MLGSVRITGVVVLCMDLFLVRFTELYRANLWSKMEVVFGRSQRK